jgi:hypothetical protein
MLLRLGGEQPGFKPPECCLNLRCIEHRRVSCVLFDLQLEVKDFRLFLLTNISAASMSKVNTAI